MTWLPRVQSVTKSISLWRKEHKMKALARHLTPNVGTLLIVGLFFFAQAAGAIPSFVPQQAGGPSATMISYQGQLTDSEGNPINGDVDMVFRLYYEASDGTAFWIEEHSGANAVPVEGGLFHVLLGSITPVDPSQLTGDVYLGIAVGGDEEMTPRELLTSIYHAVEASGIAGDLDMGGYSVTNCSRVHIESSSVPLIFRETDETGAGSLWRMPLDGKRLRFDASQNGTDFGGYKTPLSLYSDGDVSIGGNVGIGGAGQSIIRNPQDVTSTGGAALRFGTGSTWLGIDNNEIAAFGGPLYLQHSGAGSRVEIGTGVVMGGNINMNGHSVTNCGALVEANLQTAEELSAQRIDRFEQGDVLCWGEGRLEKCSEAGSVLVVAVADANGKPIVIGAEPVKVLGPVHTGDLLVASNVPGYAMVAEGTPALGTVIAKALEDFDGEQGLISAMILNH
jgi:hypothetical protein